MAEGKSPVSPLPVGQRGVMKPVSLSSFTQMSPVTVTSQRSMTGNSGNFGSLGSASLNRVTPQGGNRKRWSDYTPVADPPVLWPPTPSPIGGPTYPANDFGVPMPMEGAMPLQMQGMQLPVQQGGSPSSPPQAMQQQMVVIQIPAGQQQLMYQQQQMMPATGAPVMMMAAPAQQPPVNMVSDTNAVNSAAGRQLFNEALDPTTFDNARGDLVSQGSALHGTGRCSPCAWFWKPRGCNSDKECSYCHLCPEGELKSRKKAKVAAIRMGALEPADTNATAHVRGALKLNQLI
mmetsp:Transcript_101438/g.180326  ORF Transcript_101438/g.180326 Transcript_101438/m.180326 type:complete len:290 (-) Transcript_101438:49-918(-)